MLEILKHDIPNAQLIEGKRKLEQRTRLLESDNRFYFCYLLLFAIQMIKENKYRMI